MTQKCTQFCKRMWPNQSFLNVSTFYFCSKYIGSVVFDSETACKFSWKTLILGVCLQALTSISCWGMAEILDKELELICWRANAQNWTTAEHHGLRCDDKALIHLCAYVTVCVLEASAFVADVLCLFIFMNFGPFVAFPTSDNKTEVWQIKQSGNQMVNKSPGNGIKFLRS